MIRIHLSHNRAVSPLHPSPLIPCPPLQRSDSSHLLGDAYQPHYGSINAPGAHSVPQPDPEEIRRQRDALERICAQTSE